MIKRTQSCQRRPQQPRILLGFTLIEIMVALGIAGIIGALGISSFATAIDAEKVDGEAQAVRSVLLEARNEARVSLNCMKVDVAAQSITTTLITSCTGLDIDGIGTPTGTLSTVTTYAFDNRITLTGFTGAVASNTFYFTPKGALPYTTAITLKVKSTATGQVVYRYRIQPGIGSLVGEHP